MDEETRLKLAPEHLETIAKLKSLPKKKGRPGKEFGPLVKIASIVMHDAGMTIKDISAELKINPRTVAKALRDKAVKIETKDMAKVQQGFAEHIAQIVNKMIVAANTDEYVRILQTTKGTALATSLAIMIDKLQLLIGKPTQILETRDMVDSVQKQLQELDELQKALQQSMPLPSNPKEN